MRFCLLVALVVLFAGLVFGVVDCLLVHDYEAFQIVFLVPAFMWAFLASMFFYDYEPNLRVLLGVLMAFGWLLLYFDYWIGAYFVIVCWLVYIVLYR